MKNENIKKKLIERLADSPTALICNAYDFLGLHAPCTDWTVKCMTPEFPAMVGEAITIKLDCSSPSDDHTYEMEGVDVNEWFKVIESVENAAVPQIVVIQSLGEKEKGAVLGDGMAKTMLAAGAVGCVTDGGVRDIADIKRAGLKQFGGGNVVNHTRLRWSGFGEPVTIGGLEIKSGDIVHGDADGLITLPEEGWSSVIRACRYVLDFEKAAHVVLRSTDLSVAEKSRRVAQLSAEYKEKINAVEGIDEI